MAPEASLLHRSAIQFDKTALSSAAMSQNLASNSPPGELLKDRLLLTSLWRRCSDPVRAADLPSPAMQAHAWLGCLKAAT